MSVRTRLTELASGERVVVYELAHAVRLHVRTKPWGGGAATMTPEEARRIAADLVAMADEVERGG